MAKVRISQLPAKSANLAATDLLEVSEVSGLTYVSKKITGAELIGNVVPYTGATQDVDLGEYELKAGQIELDQSPTGTAGVAVTRWNNTIGSTETTLKGGSVILKNGVDLVARVVNKVTPNATLTKAAYQVVKVSGAQGQRLAVGYAQANNDNNSADTLGVVIETIPTNQEGFIMTVGQLDGINTTGSLQGETWADGDVLYLSPTVPGAVTKVKPNGLTGHIVIIGYVEYAHVNNGKIYVKIMNGWELDELHNVFIDNGTLANNDALIYDSSTQLWKNKTIATALGYTPEDVANKQSNLTASATKYPTVNAVNTGLSGKANTGTITGSGLTMATSRLLGRTTASSGAVEEITIGTGLTLSSGTLSAAPNVQSVTSAATVTPTDSNDLVVITAQAAPLTLAAPTGSPVQGQALMIRIKDDGTARGITWTSGAGGYRAIGVTLPTTTVISKTTYVGLIYNSTDNRWDAIGVTTEA